MKITNKDSKEGEVEILISNVVNFDVQAWIDSDSDDSALNDDQRIRAIRYSDFAVFKSVNGKFRVEDLQGGNLSDIESEVFDSLSDIVHRLETYWYDLKSHKEEVAIKTAGKYIKELREKRGINQEQLSKMSHVSKAMLSTYENGKNGRVVSKSVVHLVSTALQLNDAEKKALMCYYYLDNTPEPVREMLTPDMIRKLGGEL